MKKFNRIFFAVLLTLLAPAAFAADETAPAGTPDPAVMEKMQKLMTPNESHQALEAFAGKWTYTGKFWMTPDAPAQDMTGTASGEMIYGGRFLKQDFEGPWMGQIFNGLGYTGYDNVKKEYVSVWLDSMGTGIMTSAGQYNAATKTLSLSGSNSCPMTGETDRKGRSTWTLTDNDHNVYTSYAFGPDGKEFKSMEISYTRV